MKKEIRKMRKRRRMIEADKKGEYKRGKRSRKTIVKRGETNER